jgi:iron complex outermembrane recepter protein
VRALHRILCAAALPIAWAPAVLAQSATGAQAAEASPGLEEVVVTAQRRSEDIQRSSLAITAFSGDAIARAGLTQIQDLSNLLPGVNISLEGAQTQVYVRGVGTFAANSLADAAVAINIDQVNIARPSAVNALFYDVNRVEVLKGPQGTLYGRNASGGAVNIITNNPTFTGFSGDTSLSVGNYGAVSTEGAINMPLNDHIAFRGAFQYSKHDGYLSDGTDDENQSAVRLKALYAPNDDLTVLLSGDYAKIGGSGAGGADVPPLDSSDPWIGQSDGRSNVVKVAGTAAFLEAALHVPPAVAKVLAQQAANGGGDFTDYHPWGISADMEWNLGWGTLSVIPSLRRNDGSYFTHSGTFPFFVAETDRTGSLETRLGNSKPLLSWAVGAYYFNEHQTYQSLANTNPVSTTYSNVPLLNDENWAVFGQVTRSLTDALRLIGGARFTHESKDFGGNGYATSGSHAPVPRTFADGRTWTATNWKAGFEYDLAPQSMLYLTASTGFKAGGFGTAGAAVVPYDPEKLKAYSLGIKNRLLENRLHLNAEVFYWDYLDHQEPHLGPSPLGGGAAFYTTNAGRATIKGIELSADYQFTRNDTVKLDVEYDQSRYASFTYDENVGFANALNTGCIIGPAHRIFVGGISVPVNTIDCSGFELTKDPKWSATFSYEHLFPLRSGAGVSAELTSRASSRIWGAVDFIPNERLPSFTQTNFSLSYLSPNRALTLTAYVRNIENSNIYTNAFQAQFVPGLVAGSILAPRTYGARIAVKF